LVRQSKKDGILLDLIKGYIKKFSVKTVNCDVKKLLEDIGTFYSFEVAETEQRLLIGEEVRVSSSMQILTR
jgi:hypothetical protein